MPIGDDTYAYRGRLPHLINRDKDYFVTFVTQGRYLLPSEARDVVLSCCRHDHETMCWLHVVTVMPDHVHLIITPHDDIPLSRLLERMKGASSHLVNRSLVRRDHLWQRESFDHILRSDESLTEKMNYICENPVRKGLVSHWSDYRWTWRSV